MNLIEKANLNKNFLWRSDLNEKKLLKKIKPYTKLIKNYKVSWYWNEKNISSKFHQNINEFQ